MSPTKKPKTATFLGKACRHGHDGLRYVSNGDCVVCTKEGVNRWYARNKPEIRAARKRRYDPQKDYAETKKWRAANSEARRVQSRRYYEKHRAEILERNAAAHRRNPLLKLVRKRNYLARKRAAPGIHSAADIGSIFGLQRGRCAYCRSGLGRRYHVDHIEPLARGGSNWPKNLQLLCVTCNTSKRASDPMDFARRRGMLV